MKKNFYLHHFKIAWTAPHDLPKLLRLLLDQSPLYKRGKPPHLDKEPVKDLQESIFNTSQDFSWDGESKIKCQNLVLPCY